MNKRDAAIYVKEQEAIAENYKQSVLNQIHSCTDGIMLIALSQTYRDLEIKIRTYNKLSHMIASIDEEEEDVPNHIADVSKKVVDE